MNDGHSSLITYLFTSKKLKPVIITIRFSFPFT